MPALLLHLRGRLFDAALGQHHRSARVLGLLAGIFLLSLADLYMTLVHLRGFGMAEGNPLARGIIQYGSPAVLVAWKLATVFLGLGILFYARRRPAAELAALFCCGVLVWLILHWANYNGQISALTRELNIVANTSAEPAWVSMHPGG